MRVSPLRLGIVAACFLLAGCGRPQSVEKNYAVKGTVRVDGTALQDGMVTFLPADGKGGGTTAIVANGAFECGVAPGEKIVVVSDVKKQRTYDDPKKPVTAVVQPNAENEFEFEISSRGK